ncbi:hypothetical protein [Streptomyces sp. SM11]|uniref:hypothetical protein n=1 Tax=Streptomyces sp. SM11 TaxID=565557 RepID=UPI0015E1B255|nr:hypothetical protein [Streptomyces sp. SM11]
MPAGPPNRTVQGRTQSLDGAVLRVHSEEWPVYFTTGHEPTAAAAPREPPEKRRL